MPEVLVERIIETKLPTSFGEFQIVGYTASTDDEHYVALVKGEVAGVSDVLVRLHSECLTGDTFRSLRCDCGQQLEAALAMLEREGRGVIVYLPQEGRGIGLLNKLRAYRLQEDGFDTVDANLALGLPVDLRSYEVGAGILVDLGIESVRLITNNPAKVEGIAGYGLNVSGQVVVPIPTNPHNERYVQAKVDRLGHYPLPEPLSRVSSRGSDPGRAAAIETCSLRRVVRPFAALPTTEEHR